MTPRPTTARTNARPRKLFATAFLLNLSLSAWAQVIPDAGRLLQENAPRPAPPRQAPPVSVQPPAGNGTLPADGAQVTLTGVRIEGLSTLAPEPLVAALGPVQGKSYDLAGLRALAQSVTQTMRAAGYPFARAYLPPQDLAGGVLRVAVVEGRYGQVSASDSRAQPWLATLQPGAPITIAPLERSLLLLGDLPGIAIQPVLRSGAAVGTGDLAVQVQPPPAVAGEIGLDNGGDHFAGQVRIRGALDAFGLAMFGDRLNLAGNITTEHTWNGGASYSLPVGYEGWRGQVAVSRVDYRLGEEFKALGARGTADTLSLGALYPLLRSQELSVRVGASIQGKRLRDQNDAFGLDERKRSQALPLSLSGDYSGERNVSWGALMLSFGNLELDGEGKTVDQATARTDGSFRKLNLDVATLQSLASGWSLYARLAAQWASKNLDSSEKMVLGGPYSVRAWPSGELSGDEGALVQLELRWRSGAFEPFGFIDGGQVRINHTPWLAFGDNDQAIAGGGLGVRWNEGPWSAEGTLAWRNGDRTPTADPGAHQPQAWISAGWRF